MAEDTDLEMDAPPVRADISQDPAAAGASSGQRGQTIKISVKTMLFVPFLVAVGFL